MAQLRLTIYFSLFLSNPYPPPCYCIRDAYTAEYNVTFPVLIIKCVTILDTNENFVPQVLQVHCCFDVH